MKADYIIQAARIAHRQFWQATSDESTGDKQANSVTIAWQRSVVSDTVQSEVRISTVLNEKIDIFDLSTATAYEMKVSGKNPEHEFYKDIFKIIIYNQHHNIKIQRLVFLTEDDGTYKLNRGMPQAVARLITQYNFGVEVVEI
jgi:hypothetical protein